MSMSSVQEASLQAELASLVLLCKQLDLDTKLPNLDTRDTLVTLLVHVLVQLVQRQGPELELEEEL